jgi:uncharacterized protein YciI
LLHIKGGWNGMKKFVIIYSILISVNSGVSDREHMIVNKHLEYMNKLHKEKKLQIGGRFTDYTGGVAIMHGDSLEEVITIVNRDPAIVNKIMKVDYIKEFID